MAPHKRWMAVSDSHGDMIDPDAAKIALEFAKYFKPDIRVHLGDVFDFRCLRGKASEDEKNESMQVDIEHGLQFIKEYNPTAILRGNHDERLWDLATKSNGNLRQLSSLLIDQILDTIGDVPMMPYHKRDGVYRIGKLKMIHGYHSGITAAKQAAMVYGSVIMGHVHSIDHQPIPGIEARMGRSIGCLCRLDMDYNRAQPQTLRHAHGWAYGLLYGSGQYTCYQAEKLSGRWVLPTEFKEFGRGHD
jgi:predicted phosphodiesterase